MRSSTLLVCLILFVLGPLQPVRSEESVEVCPPIVEIPLFYATDRERITSNQDPSGSQISELSVGTGRAYLPLQSEWLNSGTSDLQPFAQSLNWKLNKERTTLKPFIEVRGYVAEPQPEKVISIDKNETDFWTDLKSAVSATPGKALYVYIHGFASSGNNAVYSAGILSANLRSPVVAFTWPSAGTAGLRPLRLVGRKRMRAMYLADREMIDRPQVQRDLAKFISDAQSRLADDCKICLVAHSLGNRLMAKYLASAEMTKLDSVYFLAADVDENLFMSTLPNLRARVRYTAIYTNPGDRVLKISGANDLLSMKVTKKVGNASFSVPGIEFVDYRKIAMPDSIEYLKVRHYVPFEHFGSIVRTGVPAKSIDGSDEYYLVRRTSIERHSKRKSN